MTQAATEGIIRLGQVKTGMQVLDVANGTGDPAITLFNLLGPDGHVQEVEARQQGVTNISYKLANAESLPFPDQSFAPVTCKHAVMLFADVETGLRGNCRVLKPGHRVVFTAQGLPEENTRQSCIMRVFGRYLEASPPAPGLPHHHRFTHPGTLSKALREAG